MKRHWTLVLASLMVVLLMGIPGPVTAAPEPGVTANQVLIGAFQDQSGPAAVVGINMRKGMEATSTGSTRRRSEWTEDPVHS